MFFTRDSPKAGNKKLNLNSSEDHVMTQFSIIIFETYVKKKE